MSWEADNLLAQEWAVPFVESSLDASSFYKASVPNKLTQVDEFPPLGIPVYKAFCDKKGVLHYFSFVEQDIVQIYCQVHNISEAHKQEVYNPCFSRKKITLILNIRNPLPTFFIFTLPMSLVNKRTRGI